MGVHAHGIEMAQEENICCLRQWEQLFYLQVTGVQIEKIR